MTANRPLRATHGRFVQKEPHLESGAFAQLGVSKGIAVERIGAIGCGMDRPIASNRTQAGRAANRRVELKLATN